MHETNFPTVLTAQEIVKTIQLYFYKNYYLLDWYDSGKCCADPPVMSQTEMTKGPSVFFSNNMRRHDHVGNINHDLRFAHLRICDNQQM